MRLDRLYQGIFFSAATLLVVMGACSPAMNKQIIKSAIDVALATCIAENPGSDEQMLKEICKYTDELAPIVRDLLAAQRKGAAKAAKPCPTPAPPAASASPGKG